MRIKFFALVLMGCMGVLSAYDWSTAPGYNKEAKKIVTMYEILDDMKVAAYKKAHAASKDDPTNPFYHFYMANMKIGFGDTRNNAYQSVKHAIALEPNYLDILKEVLKEKIKEKGFNVLMKNPGRLAILKFLDRESQFELLGLSLEAQPDYKADEDVFHTFSKTDLKNIQFIGEALSRLEAKPSKVLDAYALKINTFVKKVIDLGDGWSCDVTKRALGDYFEVNQLRFEDQTPFSDVVSEENKALGQEISEYMSGKFAEDYEMSLNDVRICKKEIKYIGIDTKDMSDRNLFYRNDREVFAIDLDGEDLFGRELHIGTNIGNGTYHPVLVEHYLNVIKPTSFKKRFIGMPAMDFDMYYMPRTPRNVNAFTKMSNDELVAYVEKKGYSKNRLPRRF